MIITHQDSTKLPIVDLFKARFVPDGRLLLAYKSPVSKGKAIVEFTPKETLLIIDAIMGGRVPLDFNDGFPKV